MSSDPNHPGSGHDNGGLKRLMLGAIGVVYGDIGTSPLYTLKECFGGAEAMAVNETNVLGLLSLVLWALIMMVTIKYVTFIMRADNHGEGGVLAIMALSLQRVTTPRNRLVVLTLGMFGASLFYGDGIITPAISVLSAVEGLEVATPLFQPYVLPLTLAILVSLFVMQKKGTDKVGAFFGPIMLIWFVTLGVLGLFHIWKAPIVLAAINPYYAAHFMMEHGIAGFLILGAVVLAVTGGEALYADMGHFGKTPIRFAWFALVLPALALNYFGQGALLLTNPEAIKHPFYYLVPNWGLYPLVALSTLATVIASQAVISGAFSLTRQAVQLGLLPRFEILHTSEREIGQIYIPSVNWALLVCICALTIGFKSSTNLAAAYGIAVTCTMAIDSFLAFIVMRKHWNWNLPLACAVAGTFLAFDGAFFLANVHKIVDGGWFPLVLGAAMFTLISTWYKGRAILMATLKEGSLPLDPFIARLRDGHPIRVPGTAIYMSGDRQNVPYALLHNIKHNKVLHEKVVLLNVSFEEYPRVDEADRISVSELGKGFYRIGIRYGFKESPDVPAALARCDQFGLSFKLMETSFFLGREKLVPSLSSKMSLWRDWVFIWMSRNALSATEFFRIPSNRVVELGAQVEL